MQLSTAIELFLSEYIRTTRETYALTMNRMADFIGPAKPLNEITTAHVLEWSAHLRKQNYADATVHKHIKTVKTFFNWSVKAKFLQESPASVIKQVRLNYSVKRDKAMKETEYEAILAYFRAQAPYRKTMRRNLALFLFIADTGCRAGGAVNLKWDDIDWENQEVTLLEKGKKLNIYYFGEATIVELKRWKIKQRADGPYTFSTNGKPPMTVASLRQIFYRACTRADVRKLGPHSLRHRKGYQMADSGVNANVAKQVLNHEDVMTTLKHYYPEDRTRAREIARQLSQKANEPVNIMPIQRQS